jgi:quercetin dioxygenase-like cupin family protein
MQSYPPPFPRENAKKVVENERLVVWDVTWPKGKPTPMHQHSADLAAVFVAPGVVKVITPDGDSQIGAPTEFGDILFLSKGVIHQEEGVSDSPRRGILVELKDVNVPPLPPKPGIPLSYPREGGKKLDENSRVTFWEYRWMPGRPVPMHFHNKTAVTVFLEPGQMKSVTPNGMVETYDVAVGTVRVANPGRIHTEEAVKGSPRAIAIELK